MKLNGRRLSNYLKTGLIAGSFFAGLFRLGADDKIPSEYHRNAAFMLKNDKTLHVKYKDRTLIEKDEINYSEAFNQADKLTLANKDGKAIINVIKENSDKLQYRKEAAIDKNGSIELNLSMKLFPFKNESEKNVIEYSFYVPFELLKNTTYKAYAGRGHAPKELEGKISDNMPDGSITGSIQNRFIAFNGNGIDLVFDFNPMGVWVRGDYCRNGQPLACWNMRKEGNYIKFSFGAKASLNGGVFSAKVLIYEGKYDYTAKHAYKEWDYTGKTEPRVQFSFGTVDSPKDFRKADTEIYNPQRGWGWEKNQNLSLLKTKNAGIMNNCVYSDTGSGTFIMDITPGCYIVTLQVCNKKEDVGPFDILLNGKECEKDISVKAGNLQVITLAEYLRDASQLKIEFKGKKNWSINSMVLQPMLYRNEDYTFDRAFWNVEGLFVPDALTVITKPEYLAQNVSFAGRSLFEAPLTAERKPEAPLELKKDILLPPDSEKLDWRWDARMGMLGGCQSSRTEFNSPGAIEQRINELAANGCKSVMISGLHVHNSFLDKMDLWIGYTKKIVEEAHRHGIKVIEHYDISIVEYSGMGLHHFIKHLDCLQRDFHNTPTLRAYCLNNPDFRKMCLQTLEKIVKETGTDGVMLDECTFAEKEFCACEHCRRKFREDTGLELPLDDSSEVFCNMQSPLWITWLNWRKKSIGDWWLDVRKTLNKVNPDASIMIYTTDNGFTHNWASLDLGFDLLESVRACDFLGTEVMPRNVFDCYRSVDAYRKTRSAIGNRFNSPLFNIIYHCGDKNFAYFGWVLCNMNRQSALMAIEDNDMKRYIDWPYQMKCKIAKSLADIAVLFSGQSRDFNLFSSHATDAIGWSEVLSDAHIMHDFILDEDINPEKLKNYKVLVLPSSSAMSRKQVEAVRKYVSEGGNLIVSGISSLADERGFAYDNFQLADVLGVDYSGGKMPPAPSRIRKKADSSVIDFFEPAFKVKLKNAKDSAVLADILDKNGKSISPALVLNKYGKGKSIFTANRLGMANFEREVSLGKKWPPLNRRNEKAHSLLVELVELLSGPDLDFKPVDIPGKVLMTAYRQDCKGEKNVLIHLLNATGAKEMKLDDIVPGVNNNRKAFFKIKEDIVFDIKPGKIQSAYIVSPDYKGERQVSLEKKDNGYWRVTVRKEDLQVYSIVYLKLAEN